MTDQHQRLTALNVTKSFIVQAPAGSGKTELLTQRFLALLATVKQPEEVIAITFTRKAATEMRSRIIAALQSAADGEQPIQEHTVQTWTLAKAALKTDHTNSWQILKNPNRLRILTIDSFCTKIAKSAPLLSQFGTLPQVAENATIYYQQAAKLLLNSLTEDQAWVRHLRTLLLHLDNNYFVAQKLFVAMLTKRDQWLNCIVDHRNNHDSRTILEQSLQNIIIDCLDKTCRVFPEHEKTELLDLLQFSNPNYHSISDLRFPESNLSEYDFWVTIAELLLTKSYDWRKTVNKNHGFPAATDAINSEEAAVFRHKKERMVNLLERLNTNAILREQLQAILLLPSSRYTNNQWQVLESLTTLLPVLVAYLHTIFCEHNVVDFITITQSALQALGDADNPSDTALNLDYQIQHMLIDEFQDTSVTQFRLLESLTAGWTGEDGKTLFLVGDPMQSIYRFREAEVGIFLKVKQSGIGSIKIYPLNLTVNFRSDPAIIDWFNSTFGHIFPEHENIEFGAITYSPSDSIAINTSPEPQVIVHALHNPDATRESTHLVEILQQEIQLNPTHKIGVLVRSRSHLTQIIPALKLARLNFRAIEIEKLIHSPAINDLFALTKAIHHLGDRVAWLSILRAPWCGLSLADLYTITENCPSDTLFSSLQIAETLNDLSQEGKNRIINILPLLNEAIINRRFMTMRKCITALWQKLGGPACLDQEHEITQAHTYFDLLDQAQTNGLLNITWLEDRIHSAYSHVESSQANIELMTIHKSKGLEYDVIIIPSLERRPAVDDHELLLLQERTNNKGRTHTILAPIKALDDAYDSIYRYVRNHNQVKNQHEIIRLLYVAATRAKKKLHLVGSVYTDTNSQLKEPAKSSFLGLLWSKIATQFNCTQLEDVKDGNVPDNITPFHLERLAPSWSLSKPLKFFTHNEAIALGQNSFDWQLHYLQHVGTVIHQELQILSQRSENLLQRQDRQHVWRKQLLQLGTPLAHIKEAVLLVNKAIDNTLADTKGQWILRSHQDAKSEYSISAIINNEINHLIIDRTFIDELGNRWIIDYKTTAKHESITTQYRQQLETYAKAMLSIEQQPIMLGLYFPLTQQWHEWSYTI